MPLTKEEAIAQLPKFAEPGSSGVLIAMIGGYLMGLSDGSYEFEIPEGFVLDGSHGPKYQELLENYQRTVDIGVDSGFGPETREELKGVGFDFELIAGSLVGMPPSIFVQPDGSKIAWSLETGAVPVGADPAQEELDLYASGAEKPTSS